MTTPRSQLVKSAQRVLEIIEYFDDEHPSATVGAISKVLDYPQSSTSVLLRCLRDLGFLYYNRAARTYRLTTRAALLGCGAEGGLYRGGKMLAVVDAVAERLGETVVLSSTYIDYAVHHLHVVRGSSATAVAMQGGQSEPVLHCVQGELSLSSYPDRQISSALHRLNVEEQDPARRVSIPVKLAELREIRRRGCWNISFDRLDEAPGVVAILMPRRKGMDRVILSVVAQPDVVRQRGEEFLQVIREERDLRFPEAALTDSVGASFNAESQSTSNQFTNKRVTPLLQPPNKAVSNDLSLQRIAEQSSALNGARSYSRSL
jgi:IclR family transcriptional regulator, KDG regulon repressor